MSSAYIQKSKLLAISHHDIGFSIIESQVDLNVQLFLQADEYLGEERLSNLMQEFPFL